MQILDNVNNTLKDDLAATISKGDKLSIAAACFSIYAYEALKKHAKDSGCASCSPRDLFARESPERKAEFYIPPLTRNAALRHGFEVTLRNELTQKAFARECAMYTEKGDFRSNVRRQDERIPERRQPSEVIAYSPINSLPPRTWARSKAISHNEPCHRSTRRLPVSTSRNSAVWNDKSLLQDVTDPVVDGITAAYNENSPEFVYFVAIYNIFNEFLEDISEDLVPNEATGFKQTAIWNKLYDFQKDAALAVINKLEKFEAASLPIQSAWKNFTALAS
jgi:hypothetical protein